MNPLASQDLAPFPEGVGAIAGVVLAGGRSTRMGRDKALLRLDGESLIRRQLRLLKESGVKRLLVAGAAGESVEGSALRAEIPPGVAWLADSRPDCGPLAGIAGALARLEPGETHLLVLAVDLPRLGVGLLSQLIRDAQQTPDAGVVPVVAGRWEPLVAVYPQAGLDSALIRLDRGALSVQDWVREGMRNAWMRERVMTPDEAASFLNWNHPEDLPGARL